MNSTILFIPVKFPVTCLFAFEKSPANEPALLECGAQRRFNSLHARVAQALHRAHLIEHWGTGTVRIVQACEERGMPRPEVHHRTWDVQGALSLPR